MSERVEPEWAMVTAAFIDIRGFTSLADRSTARQVVEYLNEFFALVIPIVTGHGGHLNKLLGDGLMCVFGAPEPTPDHADQALAAAVNIVSTVESHFGERCQVGIGINSGLVVVGAIGGGGVVELGVIGDPVNVASRVQDATRELGEAILLTEATVHMFEAAPPRLEPRGPLSLRGKRAPIAVYAPDRNAFRTPAV